MNTKYFYFVAAYSDNGSLRYDNCLQSIEGVDHFLLHDMRWSVAKRHGKTPDEVMIVYHMEIAKEEADLFRKEASL